MSPGLDAELTIEVARDHDDECAVDVIIRSGAFRGHGHMWTHMDHVASFAAQCVHLASSSTGHVQFIGGYVELPTVHVEFRPHGSRGHILVTAELTTGKVNPEAGCHVATRVVAGLIAEPAGLERFAKRLRDLQRGTSVESTVKGYSAA